MKHFYFIVFSLVFCTALLEASDASSVAYNTSSESCTTNLGQTYACPRCRRAKPPGPLKCPTPPPEQTPNTNS